MVLTTLARCCSRVTRGGAMRLLAWNGVPREAHVQENSSMGGKRRSANGALTRARASSKFLEQAT